MGELHSTDKSVIKEAFTSIRQLANPTTYGLAFQNAQAILRTADILESIGIEDAVELAELDVCVKKGIHDGRYQRWLAREGRESRSRLGLETKGTETLGLVLVSY